MMNEKYWRIINQRQLVSLMNKTKWRELCDNFEQLHDLPIGVRYKLISSDQILGFSPVWWHEILALCAEIEWIDFDPIVLHYQGRLIAPRQVDHRTEILTIFKKHSIRYSQQQQYFRVWGYATAQTHPEFI